MNKTLEKRKIDKLYELLNDTKDDEKVAALRWAIYELERIYCTKE